MRRLTPVEAVVSFVVFNLGLGVITLLAAFYPDSNSSLYASVVMVVSLLVAAFVMARKENNLNK